MESTGLPLALIAEPMNNIPRQCDDGDYLSPSDVPRCSACFGYINPFCRWSRRTTRRNKVVSPRAGADSSYAINGARRELDQGDNDDDDDNDDSNDNDDVENTKMRRVKWSCSLCGHWNSVAHDSAYSTQAKRDNRFELSETLVDIAAPLDESPRASNVCVALVDLECSTLGDASMESVKQALHAALEALPDDALFGLVVFGGESLHVFDLRAARPLAVRMHCDSVWRHRQRGRQAQRRDGGDNDDGGDDDDDAAALLVADLFRCDGDTFLVELDDEHREHAALAVDSLSAPHLTRQSSSTARPSCFGVALSATLDALADVGAMAARLSCFVASLPSVGDGALSPLDSERVAPSDSIRCEPEALDFYEAQARLAAASAIAIDVFALGNTLGGDIGLRALHVLPQRTGGELVYYASGGADERLPKDVYRHLSRVSAQQALLRVRTSPGIRVSPSDDGVHGALNRDETLADLYFTASCRERTLYAFDLLFERPDSARPFAATQHFVTVQLAFAYSRLWRIGAGADASETRRRQFWRIVTLRVEIASSVGELLASASAPAIVYIVAHKVAAASARDGIDGGRALLGNWITSATAAYNLLFGERPHAPGAPVDLSFSRHIASLGMLPRYAFALLVSPLVNVESTNAADTCVYWQARLASGHLTPENLCRFLYPLLMEFSTDGNQIRKRGLHLAGASFELNRPSFYLLDTYTDIFIYQTGRSSSSSSSSPSPSVSRVAANGSTVPMYSISASSSDIANEQEQQRPRRDSNVPTLDLSAMSASDGYADGEDPEDEYSAIPTRDFTPPSPRIVHPQTPVMVRRSPRDAREHYSDDDDAAVLPVDRDSEQPIAEPVAAQSSSLASSPSPTSPRLKDGCALLRYVDACRDRRFPVPRVHNVYASNENHRAMVDAYMLEDQPSTRESSKFGGAGNFDDFIRMVYANTLLRLRPDTVRKRRDQRRRSNSQSGTQAGFSK
jgi:Sec23/Sec24 trunk domain